MIVIVIAMAVMIAMVAVVMVTVVAVRRPAIMMIGHEDTGGKRQQGRKHQNGKFHLRLH